MRGGVGHEFFEVRNDIFDRLTRFLKSEAVILGARARREKPEGGVFSAERDHAPSVSGVFLRLGVQSAELGAGPGVHDRGFWPALGFERGVHRER